jgi:hypothetical protein
VRNRRSSALGLAAALGLTGFVLVIAAEERAGKAGDPTPDVVLATLKVEGAAVDRSAMREGLSQPPAAVPSQGIGR